MPLYIVFYKIDDSWKPLGVFASFYEANKTVEEDERNIGKENYHIYTVSSPEDGVCYEEVD